MIKGDRYREVYIPPNWKMTSQNPGKCHSRFHQAATISSLDDVMSYVNEDVVYRIAHDLSVSIERAREIFDDVKRFLFMAAQKSEDVGGVIPTPIIDEGWHSFILFTEDYERFCKKYFGTFLHHLPHRKDQPSHPREVLMPSVDAMYDTFGCKPTSNWDFVPITSMPLGV